MAYDPLDNQTDYRMCRSDYSVYTRVHVCTFVFGWIPMEHAAGAAIINVENNQGMTVNGTAGAPGATGRASTIRSDQR